jgi:hypothetical protein
MVNKRGACLTIITPPHIHAVKKATTLIKLRLIRTLYINPATRVTINANQKLSQ